MSFSELVGRVNMEPEVSFEKLDLIKDLGALLVRPIGRGSLDEVIFQMDVLHKLWRIGLPVINQPSAIEKAVDKYYALTLLGENGIVKPVFGSRGIGAARISNMDVAERAFRTLRFYRHVIYVQEFVPHGKRDIRTFIIGGNVVAAMYRVSESWKTNVSRGASAVRADPAPETEKLALNAARTIGCEIAGVDIMESETGLLVNEVNSQPGWRGLQSTTSVSIADQIAEYVLSKTRN